MKRVAEELGVSITTVSKVLNNRSDIGSTTRARVQAKVAELGYRPNVIARSLTLRRTRSLGVIVPDLMHSFFVEILAGIEAVARSRGYGLLICSSNENPGREREEIEMLRQRQVDGIVLASTTSSGNTDLLEELEAESIGLVMIDRDDHASVRCDRVVTDDQLVGELATTHLLENGRRAIGHICGPPIAHARRRTIGYRHALKAHGVPARRAWMARGGFMVADGYRAMTKLLAVRPRIDAVFAANDPSAIGAMKAIWDAKRRIPDDIAVIGAGEIMMGDLLRVPLSTVGWSRDDLGKRAAELIIERTDPDPPAVARRIIIPPYLVARRSSGGGS
jgi:LacI family transcriptional regulator